MTRAGAGFPGNYAEYISEFTVRSLGADVLLGFTLIADLQLQAANSLLEDGLPEALRGVIAVIEEVRYTEPLAREAKADGKEYWTFDLTAITRNL